MILACAKPLAAFLLPFAVAWAVTRYSPIEARRTLLLVALGVAAIVACTAVLPMAMITAYILGDQMDVALADTGNGETRMTVDGETAGLLPYAPGAAPSPLNALHSRGGEWAGRDYVRACGTAIVAPFNGRVVRGGAGVIDDWNNTYMYIKSADGRYDMLIMHSDFYLDAGASFSAGDELGATNTIGYSSECHEHISLLDNGVEVDPEQYRQTKPETAVAAAAPARDIATLTKALAALGYNDGQGNDGTALRVSHYDPSLGGTNCDSDCSTMASGQKVAAWVGGKNGIYAAACPPEWPFGTRFELYGKTYQCQDRGGWIQTRTPGEFDPAMGGFTAKESYHWVDLLDSPPVPYGALVYDWQFVN